MSYMKVSDAVSELTQALESYLKEVAIEKIMNGIDVEQMANGYLAAAFCKESILEIVKEQAIELINSHSDIDEVVRDIVSEKVCEVDIDDIAKDATDEHVDECIRTGEIEGWAKEKVDDMVTDEVSSDDITEWTKESATTYVSDILTDKLVKDCVYQLCDEHVTAMVESNIPNIPDMLKDSAERVILGHIAGKFATMEELVQECIDRRLDYQLISDLVLRAVESSKPIPKPSLLRRFLSWFSR